MRKTIGILLFVISVTVSAGAAEPPVLAHLYPVAAGAGESISVTAIGKAEPWPPQVWTDTEDVHFKPGEKTGVLEVKVDANAAPGPREVRLFNEHGASEPRVFIVAERPELAETEPNDALKTAQKIAALPATVGGRLDQNGDVDCFTVSLKRGAILTARLEGAALGSPFDGMLRVTDASGVLTAFNHDAGSLDPCLAWEAPRDGDYTLQVMGFVWPANSSVQFTGGPGCVYRLHLETAERRGCAPETESTGGEPLVPPAARAGKIGAAGEEDRFVFAAKEAKIYKISVAAARHGSPLDAWLKLQDATGKELARGEDGGDHQPDPSLTWTAPADGDYTLVLGEVTKRGGPAFNYQLIIKETPPAVTAAAAAHAVTLQPGKEAELKVTVKRVNGFQAKLRLEAKSLPEGVSAAPGEVPDQDGEVTLKLSAAADAAPFAGPFILTLRESETGAEHPVCFSLESTGNVNGVPQGMENLLLSSTRHFWLTVTRPPDP